MHGVVLCFQGKEGSEDVKVPAELLLAAQQELKGKAQMARDLEMVRAACAPHKQCSSLAGQKHDRLAACGVVSPQHTPTALQPWAGGTRRC